MRRVRCEQTLGQFHKAEHDNEQRPSMRERHNTPLLNREQNPEDDNQNRALRRPEEESKSKFHDDESLEAKSY